MVRTTERKDFKRCQQRWWWGWRQGLKPADGMAHALWFGIGLHEALAVNYRFRGTKRDQKGALNIWKRYTSEELRRIRTVGADGEEEKVEATELGTAMLLGYFDMFGGDRTWDVIQPEKAFQVEIQWEGETVCIYCGTYDLVYRDMEDGFIKLGEHKGYKAIDLAHLPMDEQTTSYLTVAQPELRAAGLIEPKEVVNEVTYNILRKALPDTRQKNEQGLYLNQNGSISKVQPAPLFHREPIHKTVGQTNRQIQHIVNETRQMNELRQHPERLTKSPTRDCKWDCAFFEMCQLHEAGEDWKLYRDGVYKREDPYADHRKSI